MNTVTFRIATVDDIPAIHSLVESAYRGDSARGGWTHEADLLDGQRTDVTALAALITDPFQQMILAEQAGKLLGCVQIDVTDRHRAYLGHLSVNPELQDRGLGRQLVAAAEHAAATVFDARAMEMTVIRQRIELIDWYKRLGYAVTGEERPFPMDDWRFGLPKIRDLAFVVLRKSLVQPEINDLNESDPAIRP